jgi:recombinational DNA repair protein (RecF pathway)
MERSAQPALVLGRTPQGERAAVLRIWLRDTGVWSAYVPSLRSSAGGFRPAMAQALAALEVVPDRGRGSLGRIKEARLEPVWRRLHDEPTAQMLVLFAAEVLRRVLHEGSANSAFFDEVMAVLVDWDRPETPLGRAPLDWTLMLCRHLGFELEAPEASQGLFYPAEGQWAPFGSFASSACTPSESEALAAALHGEPLDRTRRNEALDAALAYLEAQHTGWGQLKSLEVLRSL